MAAQLYSTPKIDFSAPIDTSTVNQRTAVVTGGASGIGFGICTALAKAGAYVAIADVNVEEGEKAAQVLRDQAYKCQFYATDVASYDSQLALFKSVLLWSPSSSIDIVVPSAGIPGSSILSTLADIAPTDDPPPPMVRTLDVDLYGVFYTTYLAVHYFRRRAQEQKDQHRPQILFVSSLAGYGDLPLNCNYAVAKFGVRGLFKALRSCSPEMGGGRVNLLAPSFISTPFTQAVVSVVQKRNIYVGEVEDAVDGAMRCLCDSNVEGRAVCIVPGKPNGGAYGSANFDLCDDPSDHDGGKELLAQLLKGALGDGFAEFVRMTKQSREAGSWQGYR